MLIDVVWRPNVTCKACRYRHPADLACADAARAAAAMHVNSESCPCELCGDTTYMLGTRRCDRCWELETRIRRDPELARTILEEIEGS